MCVYVSNWPALHTCWRCQTMLTLDVRLLSVYISSLAGQDLPFPSNVFGVSLHCLVKKMYKFTTLHCRTRLVFVFWGLFLAILLNCGSLSHRRVVCQSNIFNLPRLTTGQYGLPDPCRCSNGLVVLVLFSRLSSLSRSPAAPAALWSPFFLCQVI